MKIWNDTLTDVVYNLKGGLGLNFRGVLYVAKVFRKKIHPVWIGVHLWRRFVSPLRLNCRRTCAERWCKMHEFCRKTKISWNRQSRTAFRWGLRFIFDTKWHVVGGLVNFWYRTAFRWGIDTFLIQNGISLWLGIIWWKSPFWNRTWDIDLWRYRCIGLYWDVKLVRMQS